MKSIFAFLVLAGMLFSGAAFPDEIAGTGMKKIDRKGEGSLSEGTAYYSTNDETINLLLWAYPEDDENWDEWTENYEMYDHKKGTFAGFDYYYLCNGQDRKMICVSLIHKGGVKCSIDVDVAEGSEVDVIEITETTIGVLIRSGFGENEAGKSGAGVGQQGDDGPLNGTDFGLLNCCPMSALLVLCIGFAFFRGG